MQYIKHNNEFYKKIDLKDLDKKELIKLIKEAIEIEPRIIERWNTIYKDYTWYPQPWYTTNALGIDTTNSGQLTGDSALTELSTEHLITLCSSI